MKQICVVAFVGVLLATPVAFADFGVWNTFSVTPVNTLGSLDVDMIFTAQTTGGASSPQANDSFYFLAQLYYPYPYPATTTSVLSNTTVPRGSVSNTTWNHTFQLTAPLETPSGVWGWWGFLGNLTPSQNYVYAIYTTYGTLPVTYNPSQPTPTPPPAVAGEPVPGLSMTGIIVLSAILIGAGLLLIRRR